MITNDNLKDWVLEIDEKGKNLSPWETSFIADLIDGDTRFFTPAQIDKIKQIRQERVEK